MVIEVSRCVAFGNSRCAGHNLPEESPTEFADAVWELASGGR
jgi:hypothetical protein